MSSYIFFEFQRGSDNDNLCRFLIAFVQFKLNRNWGEIKIYGNPNRLEFIEDFPLGSSH